MNVKEDNMKNIESILKEFGLEIPEDKKEDFRKAFHENYKTVVDYGKIETDRDSWKEKAETAEETLKGFEGIDPSKIKDEIADWKKKAEDAEKEYSAKMAEHEKAELLKEAFADIEFTSESAKKAIMQQISEGVTVKNGKLIGFKDLLEDVKNADASAFVDKEQQNREQSKAKFTQQMNGNGSSSTGGKDLGSLSMAEYIAARKNN